MQDDDVYSCTRVALQYNAVSDYATNSCKTKVDSALNIAKRCIYNIISSHCE